ncbi:MAG: DUF5684 domain-containing protein [Bacteroidota bacterium]
MNSFISLHSHSVFLAPEEVAAISVVAAFALLYLVSLWRLFEKAGRAGWESLIPFYNAYVVTQIAGKSGWWAVGLFVPFFNIIARVILGVEVAQKFDRSSGFGVGLGIMPGIFLPILAFSRSEYMDAVPPNGFRTFVNEEGDIVEEVPLEEWGNEEENKK